MIAEHGGTRGKVGITSRQLSLYTAKVLPEHTLDIVPDSGSKGPEGSRAPFLQSSHPQAPWDVGVGGRGQPAHAAAPQEDPQEEPEAAAAQPEAAGCRAGRPDLARSPGGGRGEGGGGPRGGGRDRGG